MRHCETEYVDSDETLHFTTAIVSQDGENEDISMPSTWVNTSTQACKIEGVSIQSKENLEWDLILWSKASADDTTLSSDAFITKLSFPPGIAPPCAV